MKPKNLATMLIGWVTLGLAPLGILQAQPGGGATLGAQSSGTITGRVSNAATGALLEDALVTLQPLGRTTMTGPDGRYVFTQVPAGTYEVSASYTGLDSGGRMSVSLVAGGTTARDFELTSEIYRMDAVVVAGEREGTARAIQVQRYAPNVKNILASDAFGNVTDDNVGYIMQRLPGITIAEAGGVAQGVNIRGMTPNLSAITIDGTRVASGRTDGGAPSGNGGERGIDLDLLSAEAIETIEVTKGLTPDMDADSIGGAVNLVTKGALSRKGRSITFRLGETYNMNRHTFRPSMTFSYSDIFGEKRNLGILITGNYSKSNKSRDNYRLEFQPVTDENPLWVGSQFNEDALNNRRAGGSVRLDYRLSPKSSIFLTTQYNRTSNKLFRRRALIQPNPTETALTTQVFDRYDANGVARTTTNAVARFFPGWSPTRVETINMNYTNDLNATNNRVDTLVVRAGGETVFATARLNYDVNFSRSEGNNHRAIAGAQVQNVGFRFEKQPTEWGDLATYTQTSGPDVFDWANFRLSSYNLQQDAKRDEIKGAQLNFRQDLALALPTYYKTGFRLRSQTRRLDIQRPTFTPAAPAVMGNIARFHDAGYTYEIFDGLYHTLGWVDPNKLAEEKQARPELFPENVASTTQNSLINDMEASEDIYAAYLMGVTKVGRLGVVGGLRVEETHVSGSANTRYLSPEEIARRAAWVGTVTPDEQRRRTTTEFGNWTTRKGDYRNWFPSLHFRYEFTKQLLGRASWSTGIARPTFGNIIPNDNINDESMSIVTSNPALEPQFADSYDLSFEYYFEPAGMVTLGFFDKEMKNFITTSSGLTVPSGQDNGFGGDYAGYTLRMPINVGKARVNGVEVAYQQQLSFLPGFWRGFGVFGNFTWLKSSGDFGNYGRPGSLPGFSPRSGSGGVSYSGYGFSFRVLATWKSENANGFNANPGAQLYNAARWNVDVLTSYAINRRLSLYCDIRNLTDEHIGKISQYIHPRQFQRFATEVTFGVSGRF